MAVDLITSRHVKDDESPRCHGVYALDIDRGRVETLAASQVVLSTGGVGKVYRYTSNPDTATGDGIAMAWRAGCRVGNMEFIQFHPTCLYHPQERSFLITEALRGEGAHLKLPDGTRLHGRARRAAGTGAARHRRPRDRLRDEEAWPGPCVARCDASRRGSFSRSTFPTIHARCLKLGIDIARQPIPVCRRRTTPAAASSPTSKAAPTCRACTPSARPPTPGCTAPIAWPATRCSNASSSATPARRPSSKRRPSPRATLPPWDESKVENADEQVVISHNWDELRLMMWNYVGIVRTTKRLERALHRIDLLKSEIDEYYANFRVTRDLLELRNLVECAELIVRSALSRHESRGLHFSRDYPRTLPVSFPTVLIKPEPRFLTKPAPGLRLCAIEPGFAATKASMRSMQPSACVRVGSGTTISPLPVSRQAIKPCVAFIAIHGQCAQLLHVALLPAVGASISVLPGASCCMRWNMPLSVATMYSLALPSTTAFNNCEVEPTRSACINHGLRRLGMHQHHRLRVLLAQQFQLDALELVVNDAGAVPHQHVGAGLLLDVAAEVLVGRPQHFLALLVQVTHDRQRARARHHPVGTGFDGRAGVGIDDDLALRVRVAEGGEFVRRAAEVERAGGFEVGHQHAFVRRQNLRALAHEAHARDDQCLRGVVAAEARHLERIGHTSAALLRQVLQIAIDVVVRDEHGVVFAQQRLGAGLRGGALARRVRVAGTRAQACAVLLAPVAS